jgi:glycosyltransferase involved in cell wall biosynthesis
MASVLVSPRLEPYVTPLKIYAYMASGRPIVATDLPTHTEVLDLNSAILAPPTAEGMADGIARAFSEPARSARLGLRARQLVERDHTFAAFRAKLADVYAHVETQRRATRPAHERPGRVAAR